MKIKSFIIVLLVSITFSSFAQNVLDGVYVKEHTLTRQVIPYPYLREADVMFSKRIWRVMDLQEKINLPFKYPLSKSTTNRKNLMDVFLNGINRSFITQGLVMFDNNST